MKSDFDKYMLVPRYSALESRSAIDLSWEMPRYSMREWPHAKRPFSLPIISSPMSSVTEGRMAMAISRLGGVGVIHRYMTPEAQMAEQIKSRIVGISISSKDDGRSSLAIAGGADFLMIDVAHGDSLPALLITEKYARQIPIISGNIVTVAAAKRYLDVGAAGLRVGIGTGSACTTRTVAGVGVNQLEALMNIRHEFPNALILSCGGIRNSGDIVKALAAGANAVIIGGLFAGTDSAPQTNGRHLGMASIEAEKLRIDRTGEDASDLIHLVAPEGKDISPPNFGRKLEDVVRELEMGIRIGFGYLGARTIKEAWSAEFVQT